MGQAFKANVGQILVACCECHLPTQTLCRRRDAPKLNAIGEQFKVNFVVSISVTKEQLPETYYDGIIAEL